MVNQLGPYTERPLLITRFHGVRELNSGSERVKGVGGLAVTSTSQVVGGMTDGPSEKRKQTKIATKKSYV